MMAVIIAELTKWNGRYFQRTLPIMIGSSALAGILTKLRPEYLFSLWGVLFIWIGIQIGKPKQTDISIQTWLNKGRLTPWRIICGKILASIIISLIHIVILFPIVILTNAIWGVMWDIFIAITVIWLIITSVITSLGMLIELLDWSEFPLILFVLGWQGITLIIPQINRMNPFFEIWRTVVEGVSVETIYNLIYNFGLVIVISIIAGLLLKREIRT